MTIGERIKNRRGELGITQEELATILGYKNKSTIAKIETGINDIAQSKVFEFAAALHTTVAYLMGWEEERGEQMDSIGKRIHDLRVARGWTLEFLGDKVGVGKSTVRKWEEGMIADLKTKNLEKVAKAFGVSPMHLIEGVTEPEEDMGGFNEKLRAAREMRGLSQKEVAERIGVAKSTYSLYESGQREPGIKTIRALMEVLRVNANYLFDVGESSEFDREAFLETELGAGMVECAREWDTALKMRGNSASYDSRENLIGMESAIRCQAQWEVYKMALKQFCGMEYFFTRTCDYYGICTEDGSEWLFREER